VAIKSIFSKCFSLCYITNNWIGGVSNIQGGNKKFIHFRDVSIMRSSDLSERVVLAQGCDGKRCNTVYIFWQNKPKFNYEVYLYFSFYSCLNIVPNLYFFLFLCFI
jgi:hypothetical protein